MLRKFIIISGLLLMTVCAYAQTWTISGIVTDKNTGKPVEYATVVLESTAQWAVAGADGKFSISNVQSGKNIISISCLGYVTDTKEITISRNVTYKVSLAEDNLALEGVVVTAKEKENTATTSRLIDKTALDHVQMMNVSDISSFLPGGVTQNPILTSEQQFDIRAGEGAGGEKGSSSFGTAVEVDGVRLSNNGSFSAFSNANGGAKGVSTNNIASTNVESIEVITGVPSVEYGDMTSGVVKINTRKGKTPYIVTMSTNPHTKQVSASKGFSLGSNRSGASNGILNANMEYTKAIGNKMSPYTGYDRNQLSLIYSNAFNSGIFSGTPLQFTAGVTGNIGGMNSRQDPDAFLDTFQSKRDDSFRGNISLNWLLSKPWITNIELNASIVYSNKQQKERKNYSSSSSSVAIHGTEEGYFVAQDYNTDPHAAVTLIPRGYWFNTMAIDDRPLNYKVALKANWARQWGKINNKVKIGADWTGDGNFGTGMYSEDMSNAPSFHEYRFNEVPFMNNVAAYLENNIMIPIGKTRLNIIAGIRNDNTIIKGSEYGVTSSYSPRFNAKYTVISPKGRRSMLLKELSFRGSWGVAVKLPSFAILFPEPQYRTIASFIPPTAPDGSSYMAYYISPRANLYNPDLKWQRNRQAEIGMDIDLGGNRISLAAYYNVTRDAYRLTSTYVPFSYNYTSTEALKDHCTIPVENRVYGMDKVTGQVTVSDKTGSMASQAIPYAVKEGFDGRSYTTNDTGIIKRYGVECIIDFKKVEAINTTFRIDGSYYGYRSVDTNLEATAPYTSTGFDKEPFKYIAFYYGGDSQSNGSEIKTLKTNLTVTTHIPQVRLIVSLKLQATLLRYQRYLSERGDGSARGFIAADRSNILSAVEGSIYDGNNFVVTYPDFVISLEDLRKNPDLIEQIKANPDMFGQYAYLPKLKDANKNDGNLYSDLSKFAGITTYNWYFGKDYISPYFSANISVTKEIGDMASLSFYANNFFNNLAQVKSSKSNTYSSVSGTAFSNSGYAPGFFYGLSLRLKF